MPIPPAHEEQAITPVSRLPAADGNRSQSHIDSPPEGHASHPLARMSERLARRSDADPREALAELVRQEIERASPTLGGPQLRVQRRPGRHVDL